MISEAIEGAILNCSGLVIRVPDRVLIVRASTSFIAGVPEVAG